MTREEAKIVQVLINFFEEGFQEDPIGVADWFAVVGLDVNEFKEQLRRMCDPEGDIP